MTFNRAHIVYSEIRIHKHTEDRKLRRVVVTAPNYVTVIPQVGEMYHLMNAGNLILCIDEKKQFSSIHISNSIIELNRTKSRQAVNGVVIHVWRDEENNGYEIVLEIANEWSDE